MPEANPSIFTLTNLGETSLPLENNSWTRISYLDHPGEHGLSLLLTYTTRIGTIDVSIHHIHCCHLSVTRDCIR